jgi:hypothetical protein
MEDRTFEQLRAFLASELADEVSKDGMGKKVAVPFLAVSRDHTFDVLDVLVLESEFPSKLTELHPSKTYSHRTLITRRNDGDYETPVRAIIYSITSGCSFLDQPWQIIKVLFSHILDIFFGKNVLSPEVSISGILLSHLL